MINKNELHKALIAVEEQYGSVIDAPNSAMRPIWQITGRVDRPIYVSQKVYETIEAHLKDEHPQPEYVVAKELGHDPTWLRFRVQAYKEERLVIKKWRSS